MISISIIIVNLNTRELLKACLSSVFAEIASLQSEILVIDNGSTDGSIEMVQGEFPSVRLTVNQTNEGFARPNNTGMSMAQGRYVFLLNSDTEVRPNAIRSLLEFLDTHSDAAACGPMLIYPDGRLQHSVRGFPTLWTHFCDMFLLDKIFSGTKLFGRGDMAYFTYDQTGEVDHVMAAAFMVRREILSSVGGFDEKFSIYYNDMDWCYRIRQGGWKIFYVHTSQVVHHHGRTIAQVNKDFRYFLEMHENTMWFYHKHYGRWSVVVYKLLLACGFVPRTIGWAAVWGLRRSDHAHHMLTFSARSLMLGLRFWEPVPYGKGFHS